MEEPMRKNLLLTIVATAVASGVFAIGAAQAADQSRANVVTIPVT
jgi:hypothetical protein